MSLCFIVEHADGSLTKHRYHKDDGQFRSATRWFKHFKKTEPDLVRFYEPDMGGPEYRGWEKKDEF